MKKKLGTVLLAVALVLTMGLVTTTPVCADIVGLWHLDDNALDSSGYGNDGTVYGATYVNGMFDKALSFDGSDDYVQLPASNSILGTDTFTVEAWFKTSYNHPDYGYGEGRLVNLHRMNTASTAVSLYVEQDKIGLLYYTGSGYVWVKYTVDYDDGVWHHIAVTHDDTTYRLYYDGTEVASQDDDFGDFGIYPAYLGTYDFSGRFFNGTIDEVRIWDEALSAGDIEASASLKHIVISKTLIDLYYEDQEDPPSLENPIVPMATEITFTMQVTVENGSNVALASVKVKDPLPAELEVPVDPVPGACGGIVDVSTKGKSKKVFIKWYPDDVAAGYSCTLEIVANTDINPGGGYKVHQEYTSPGIYDLNAGATLSFCVTIANESIYLVLTTDGLWVEAVGVETD